MARKRPELTTLWKAETKAGKNVDHFYFRSTEEFMDASKTAQDLLDSSPACQVAGAVIVRIERVARMWN